MSNIDSLLDSLYSSEHSSEVEKTASAEEIFSGVFEQNQKTAAATEVNPFEKLSLEELMELASEVTTDATPSDSTDDSEAVTEEATKEASSEAPEELEASTEDQEVSEEINPADILAGKLMAHASVHEMAMAKEAMINGLCRVCKTSPMDVEGTSVCSTCQG